MAVRVRGSLKVKDHGPGHAEDETVQGQGHGSQAEPAKGDQKAEWGARDL